MTALLPHTEHSPPKRETQSPFEAQSPASGTCSGGDCMGSAPSPEPFTPYLSQARTVPASTGPASGLGTCTDRGTFVSTLSPQPRSVPFLSLRPLTAAAPGGDAISHPCRGHLFGPRLRVAAFWAGEAIGAACVFLIPLLLLFFGGLQ